MLTVREESPGLSKDRALDELLKPLRDEKRVAMSETAAPSILGIDISKASVDVALLAGAKRPKRAKFANQYEGFEELQQWLQVD